MIGAIIMLLVVVFARNVVAENLQLGTGDVVKVSVYGSPDLAIEARVREAGRIGFPLIGEVSVFRLSTYKPEQKISKLRETGGFIRKAQVNCFINAE